jgi:hypothetical protein
MTDNEYTPRGFRIYAEFTDEYKNTIRVQESSNVYGGIWIFCNDYTKLISASHPHLSIENAKTLIKALQEAIRHQEDSTRIWRD